MDEPDDCSLEDAAVILGVSPGFLARLLDTGRLPGHPGPDGRRSRVRLADLQAHRDERFALRQHLAQQSRARRFSTPEADPGVLLRPVGPGAPAALAG